jgi:uncharacterized repeat protein (TIGR01451 family)
MQALCKRLAGCLLASLIVLFMPAAATAQTTTQYTNSTSGVISSTASTCAAPLVQTFTVGTSFTVADVDLGVLINHPQRGDLRIWLRSPAGTLVRVFNRSGGVADNFNVLLDDEAASSVGGHTANDTVTTVPPYQRTFQPDAAMSAFDGQNSLGTWQVEICDNQFANSGTFNRADLYLTSAPPNADLSLTKTVSSAAISQGASFTYTLQVTNAAASALTANGVAVRDVLPANITFVSATGTGTYDNATGIWTVGSIPPGTTRTLTITATVNAAAAHGTVVTNSAEVSASSATDPDSTPNNNSTNEDDDAQVGFTVQRVAGVAPIINCPVGSTTFDWAPNAWPVNSLNNTYNLSGVGNFNINMTSMTPYVAGSPAISSQLTGGVSGELSLFQNLNNNSNTDTATTVLTMPGGLPGVQFTLFDIDFGSGSYADKVVVTGSYQGNPVIPVLTNNTANYVIGNVAIGDVSAVDTTAAGNVVVTFNAPIDTVTVVYGNHTTAPADPGNQWIGWGDIRFCNPYTTSVNVSKISWVVSDGVSGSNPKALPGATVRYCITVANTGGSTMGSVVANDSVPTNLTFIAGSIRSGTTCGGAANVEDDGNSGADETDPFGGYFIGTTVTGTAATLSGSSAFVFTFDATVN